MTLQSSYPRPFCILLPSYLDLVSSVPLVFVWQENRAAVNYIEGVLGGNFSQLDLTTHDDKAFLLDALAAAAARGLFN
jgi:hypothetical protein